MTREQKNKLKNAVLLFKEGDFNGSKKVFSEILPKFPEDKTALLLSGYIALLENRLKDAANNLQKALQLMPRSKAVKHLLIDVYYRLDDYTNASSLMNSVKRYSQAAKLDYMRRNTVYDIISSTNTTELEFLVKDPLPLIKVSINGAPPVNFLLDTGAGELIINAEYAKKLGLKEFGSEKSVFGGGKKGAFIHSCINSIILGDFQINNVPAILMDTGKFSSELYADNFKVDGILGTCIFNRFLTTMDYASDKIIFEILNKDKTVKSEGSLKAQAFEHIPFWMASDHIMLAKGKANNCNEMLFFVDTGLGGNAFTCPKSTMKKCGFTLMKDKADYGSGGGGKMKITPFDIESLTIGSINEKNLHGAFGAFPPSFENSFGFKIGGLISHEFFRNHTVVFDFSKMMLHIK